MDAITNSLDSFVRKLRFNFNAIETYAKEVQGHTHVCVGACSPPKIRPLEKLHPLRRSLVFNNASETDHRLTVDFLRESLSSPANSPVDNIVLALLLSDQNTRAAVVGPLLADSLGEQEQGDDNDEMVVSTTEVENLRKLSGKFSGISQLLNRTEQGRYRSDHAVETTETTDVQTLPKSKMKLAEPSEEENSKVRRMKESPIYYFE